MLSILRISGDHIESAGRALTPRILMISEAKDPAFLGKMEARYLQVGKTTQFQIEICYPVLFPIPNEGVRRFIEWLLLRLIKVEAMVSYHAKKWHVHISSTFPFAHHYQEGFSSG